jgi:hypothetical protein
MDKEAEGEQMHAQAKRLTCEKVCREVRCRGQIKIAVMSAVCEGGSPKTSETLPNSESLRFLLAIPCTRDNCPHRMHKELYDALR